MHFFYKECKLPNPEDIDRVISTEIPDLDEDPELYKLVTEIMMHGPCGPDNRRSPYMKNNVCSKKFPMDFTEQTRINAEGYPIYKRSDNGRKCVKNNVELDNRCNPLLYICYFIIILIKIWQHYKHVFITDLWLGTTQYC